jgi:transposase-like protein
VILFIALPWTDDKAEPVVEISLAQLPRRCPICGQDTIIGHGRRRKQAHDDRHDWIWVRRGRCPACKKTFTTLRPKTQNS